MTRYRSLMLKLLITISMTSLVLAQEPAKTAATHAEASRQYQNTSEDLRSFLEEILAATKGGDHARVSALIKLTEIPNYASWYRKMYPPDKAESWIGPYGQNLEANEQSFKDLFTGLANRDGAIGTRKLQDTGSSNRGMEWAMLHSAREPLDVYYAGWVSRGSDKPKIEPLGYFIFVDGMFRWYSLIHSIKPTFVTPTIIEGSSRGSGPEPERVFAGEALRVGGSVSAPRVTVSPDPDLSKLPKKHPKGVVTVSVVVDVDGLPKNVQVSRSLDETLDRLAVESVRGWRFLPSMKDGKPVPARINVEVRFE